MSHAIEWLGAGGVGLSFLGTLWAYVLIKGKLIVAAKTKRLTAAYEASRMDADGEPKTPLLSEDQLARSLRGQLDEQERLHSAEARSLRLRVRELEQELREERGKNASLTYATSKLRDEYRRSLGLTSDPPPADHRSSGAITAPPPKPR